MTEVISSAGPSIGQTSLFEEFWKVSSKDLGDYPATNPHRVAFNANIHSLLPECLAIFGYGDFSSATWFNDYYKLSMAPVIAENLRQKGKVVVTFAVSLRSDGLGDYLASNQDGIRDKVIKALDALKFRYFNLPIILSAVQGKSIEEFWQAAGLYICGPAHAPRSLIRAHRVGSEENFWHDTVIYNRQTGPEDVEDDEVVLSAYFAEGKFHIEATGPWNRCSFLETTMMQTVYQTLLEHHRSKYGISFTQWLYESLFRTHLSCVFATQNCPEMKGALFAGRRTGHHLFTLLQTWYVSRFYPNCIGASSFDACHTLTNVLGLPKIVRPVGTHAHELSMVLMCLWPELDENPEMISFSQCLSHYQFYRLVHKGFAVPMPMLPDTLGTQAFLKAAENTIVTPMKNGVSQEHQKCKLVELFDSARQDSGKIPDFKPTLGIYGYEKGMMASEISSCEDLMVAASQGFKTFGTGGFMGDSEKGMECSKGEIRSQYGSQTYACLCQWS
jgi:nicotinic acid phosphoribosyltransferase